MSMEGILLYSFFLLEHKTSVPFAEAKGARKEKNKKEQKSAPIPLCKSSFLFICKLKYFTGN